MKPYRIDQLDLDILEILEEDCSLTYGDIAEKLGKNIWTVRDRMVLLKQREILKGCRAVIDYAKLGAGCKAMISFNIPPERIDDFISKLKHEKRIKRFTLTTGSRRFHIQITGDDCGEIRNFARKLLPPFGIEDIDFEVILDEIP
jgi:Lrp/AsnC family leucine-responsive transcriptional regulator